MKLDLSAILAAKACGGSGSGGTGTDGKNAYIRFSASSDGADMTETWSEGQRYVGFTTGRSAPTNAAELVWCRFIGDTDWSIAAREALLNCFSHVAWIGQTDGASCIADLRAALGMPAEETASATAEAETEAV